VKKKNRGFETLVNKRFPILSRQSHCLSSPFATLQHTTQKNSNEPSTKSNPDALFLSAKSIQRRVPDELSDWLAFGLLKLPKKE
jgi:hypothetical protein